MLPRADAALLERDPALPGLRLLLDQQSLDDLLGSAVTRRSLRYKPGTSAVLGVVVGGQPASVSAHPPGADKLTKSVALAPAGTLLHVDAAHGLYAARPAADRDLRALAVLAAPERAARLLSGLVPGLAGADVAPLSYNPHRRWVARLTPEQGPPVVLRVQRPADAAAAARAAGALERGTPRTPRVLARRARKGVTALEWLPGTPLDEALRTGDAGLPQLAAAGRVLAQLHARRVGALAGQPVPDDGVALRAAADAVAAVLPALASRARALAARLAPELAAGPGAVVLHGDFSLDQVVLSADGSLGLVDLDRVRVGEAALDLGTVEASLVAERGEDQAAGWAAALADGYAEDARLPEPRRRALHVSAALLRQAVEPFRRCRPEWDQHVERLLAAAERRAPR